MSTGQHIKRGSLLDLTIEKLVYGGNGLARHNSIVCFVGYGIPGEQICAKVETVKKNFITASVQSITRPSSYRITPACSLFSVCGGCHFQHMAYDHQLYWKKKFVKESLFRIARISNFTVCPVLPSARVFGYRGRTNLKVGFSKNKEIGYYKRASHTVVPVRRCPLLSDPLNNALGECIKLFSEQQHHLRNVVSLDLVGIKHTAQVLVCCRTRIKQKTFSYLFPADATRSEPGHENIMGVDFIRSTESFYQVNFDQNLEMIQLVVDCFSDLKHGAYILDLYCGCGNFSLFLAREGYTVSGIDANSAAVKEAETNARKNDIPGCSFFTTDLNGLSRTVPNRQFDGILMNPPRTGCSQDVLQQVSALSPCVVVYVSCNPATLARDLEVLLHAGYRIDAVQPVDMFPQTYHIETIVRLIR